MVQMGFFGRTNINLDDATRHFKSGAWSAEASASRYVKHVNRSFTLADIDIRTQLALVEEFLPPGAPVLDVGAGTGALALPLAASGYKVTALDISAAMLKRLKRFDKSDQIKTVVADLFEFGEMDDLGPFAGAVSRWVLPHFTDYGSILASVAGLLSPGGVFVFDMPSKSHVERALLTGAIRPEHYGYDHAINCDEVDVSFFYMAESDENLKSVLASSGFDLVLRRPYGLLKSNLLAAIAMGGANWKSSSQSLNKALAKDEGLASLIFGLEVAVTKHLPADMVHGSFVVARKHDRVTN